MSSSLNRKLKRECFKGHAKILRNFYNKDLTITIFRDYIKKLAQETDIETSFENVVDYMAKEFAEEAEDNERQLIKEYIDSDACLFYEFLSNKFPGQTMNEVHSGAFCIVLGTSMHKEIEKSVDDYTNMKELLTDKNNRDLFNMAILG